MDPRERIRNPEAERAAALPGGGAQTPTSHIAALIVF